MQVFIIHSAENGSILVLDINQGATAAQMVE